MQAMAGGDAAVRLENVGRVFGNTAALRNLSLDIKRGDVLSLVGHSGCGKSTLLRIIAGVETIDSGRLLLDGRQVDGDAFVEPEARSVGFVFQDYALFPHLSARDNILFGLKRWPKAKAAESADDVARRTGVAHLLHRFPHTLSGGEQQRVALARALAPRPGIVLLDEPFSNLDQGLRARVRQETLSLLKSLGTTVVMVTHDPQEALSSGDHVVLMREGEIVQAGSAYDLYDRPVNAYAADFFCEANKVPGIFDGANVLTPLGRFAAGSAALARDVVLHVRPQAITVSPDRGDIPARIEARQFQGEAQHVLLRVEGLETPLSAVTRDRLPEHLSEVRLTISPQQVFMF